MINKRNRIPFFFSFLLILFFLSFLFLIKQGQAGAGQNVSGFAWSENIGWISFNSTSGGGPIDYGVNVDLGTGIFSGFAWSDNIGWVSFNESDLGGCPTIPCRAWSDTSCPGGLCQVSGWAKILSYPSSGWVRLRGTSYGVSINQTPLPDEFTGYAWSDEIGWISFAGANYKVILSGSFNDPPSAVNLWVTPPNPIDYGGVLYPPVRVNWEFSDPDPGDTQAYFRVQVSTTRDFTSIVVDTGQTPGSGQGYVFSEPGKQLSFNQTYYWRVKVWDENGGSSGWIYPPSPPGSPTPPGSAVSFTTPLHPYPLVNFDWTPVEPQKGEITQFCSTAQTPFCTQNKSTCYNASQQPISCAGSTFNWIVAEPGLNRFVEETSSASMNPRIEFYSSSPVQISLEIIDQSGYGPVRVTKNVTLKIQGPACTK
jgi:hypothetical protein